MYTWKHQDENGDAVRYGATFELPDAILCWLRGHRARVEVREPEFTEPWVLVECVVCGLRYSNPAAVALKMNQLEAKEHEARRLAYARRAPEELAKNCSERDGYGHRRVVVTLEIAPRRYWAPGFELKLGNRQSETPIDAVVHGWRRSYWLGIEGVGALFAERVTGGKKRVIRLGGRYIEGKRKGK
jgi:hypothetical protein